MDFLENEEYNFFAITETVNIGEDFGNINVLLEDGTKCNIKLDNNFYDFFKNNKIYYFKVIVSKNKFRERLDINLVDAIFVYDYFKDDLVGLDEILKKFYKYAPINTNIMISKIEEYISKIENKVLYDITSTIYKKYKNQFYIYPAATKFHHTYIGGLAFHTYQMISLCDTFIKIYRHINKDYCYAGIILHDILKVKELSEAEGAEYTTEGNLIGHINLCMNELAICASKLGYLEKEEYMLLSHIILSHHGQFSQKRPMTAEAFLVSFLDNFDSKMTVLQEELDKIKNGTFTDPLRIMEREKFYKRSDDL